MMKIQIICRVWSPGSPPFFGCLSISWFNWIFESHANFFCNLIGRGLDDPEIGDMPSWWPHSLACPLLPRCTTGCLKSMFRLYPKCAFYAIYAYCACCVDTDEQAVLSVLVAPSGDKIMTFLVALICQFWSARFVLICKTLLDTLSSQSWCTTGQTLQYELMYYNPAAGLISDGLSFFVPPLDSSSYYPTLAELWWLCAFPLARHFWQKCKHFFAVWQ